jgi:arginyl-tRNA synthetase
MTDTIHNKLIRHTVEAVASLYGASIEDSQVTLQETRKEFEGQITIVTFPYTRFSKGSPEATGEAIGSYLQSQLSEIESYNIIKGFLNISLTDTFWIQLLQEQISAKDFGFMPSNGQKVMVEYSSPNTNKPLHLGHIRNNLLGYSVAAILDAAGFEVVKANLVNDRGIHICKSMLAWQHFGNEETPESSGLKGDHLVGKYYVIFDKAYKEQINQLVSEGKTEEEAKKQAPLILEAQEMLRKWEQNDEDVIQLWKTMNGWVYDGFKKTYEQMGVDFDQYYYESDTYLLGKDLIQEGLDKGVFFKKEDQSVWIDLTSDGLDQKLVLRGDGTSVYITQDMGTAQLKYDDYRMEKSIYVVGNEQDYHFKVLFLILDKLGKSWAKGLYHLSYGMVDLPSGKMKSREGTVVDADDLMDEMIQTAQERTEQLGKSGDLPEEDKDQLYKIIGMGALKYFLLKVEPKKRLLFNPAESIDFQGHTGPFIQYTFARIQSVIQKAGQLTDLQNARPIALASSERDLIVLLQQYPEVLQAAAREMSPALVANYAYELAKAYNKFYHEESILKIEDETIKKFRLSLSQATARLIERSMNLLGIEVPERM